SESPEQSLRHGNPQPVDEDQPVRRGGRERNRDGDPPSMPSEVTHQHDEEKRRADDHAEHLEQGDERGGYAEHHEYALAGRALRHPPGKLLFGASEEHQGGEAGHDHAEPERQERRARPVVAPPLVELERPGRERGRDDQQQDRGDAVGAAHLLGLHVYFDAAFRFCSAFAYLSRRLSRYLFAWSPV